MHNYIKLSLALVVFISMMSFSDNATSTVKSTTKTSVAADTLNLENVRRYQICFVKTCPYGEVEFPQVNMKLKMMQKKTVFMSGFYCAN